MDILDRPSLFLACTVMWIVHGFILDVFVIGILPFLSAEKSDAERADKFPWALGGYDGYPKVSNLAPTHRRFIAENAAYALTRIAPAIFITNVPIILICVLSYAIEAITISWEIRTHGAPANAMLPQTLMCVFGAASTYTVMTNPDGFIAAVDANLLMAMKGAVGVCLLCWVGSAASIATRPKSKAK